MRWFQDRITENPKLEVIDAKEKGAKIKGTINMSLSDAVNKYCTTQVDIRLFDTLDYTFDSSQIEEVKTYLEKQYNELDVLKKKLEKAIDICNKQIKEYGKNIKYLIWRERMIKNYYQLINILKIHQYIFF